MLNAIAQSFMLATLTSRPKNRFGARLPADLDRTLPRLRIVPCDQPFARKDAETVHE